MSAAMLVAGLLALLMPALNQSALVWGLPYTQGPPPLLTAIEWALFWCAPVLANGWELDRKWRGYGLYELLRYGSYRLWWRGACLRMAGRVGVYLLAALPLTLGLTDLPLTKLLRSLPLLAVQQILFSYLLGWVELRAHSVKLSLLLSLLLSLGGLMAPGGAAAQRLLPISWGMLQRCAWFSTGGFSYGWALALQSGAVLTLVWIAPIRSIAYQQEEGEKKG